MADLIKTWPRAVEARVVARIFSATAPAFKRYYFTLGPRHPKLPIVRLWFTYHGRILGSFAVDKIVCNDGTLPELRRLDGGESEWQIRKDSWVAVCAPPMQRLKERVFMDSFRGWHYFDLAEWKDQPESRHRW